METRSSYVLVGAVVLALTVLLFGFVLWIARYSNDVQRPYDILFRQSVSGLLVGSAVQFKGVPVGQIKTISLMPEQPDLVRVRIEITGDVPILEGTTAAIEGVGFTGVSQIQLEGAMKGEKPITEIGPFGVPLIPARPGTLGQLLASAPELLSRVSELTQHLNELLNPKNQESLAGILANTNKFTGALAKQGDQLGVLIGDLRHTLQAADGAAGAIEKLSTNADGVVRSDVQPLIADLRVTTGNANRTLAKLDGLVDAAKPGVAAIGTEVIPDASAAIRQLQDVTQQLGAIAAKLDTDPAGALIGGRTLPDYKPAKAK